MRHFHSFEEVELKNAWATIGTFDGVHRGHQAILAPLAREAHAAGSPAVVVTFHPHPAVVLRGLTGAYLLTMPDERAELFSTQGIDTVITLLFDHQLASLSAREFMTLVKDHIDLRQLWVGYDFALGRNRQGDIPTLRQLGEEYGYSVHVIPEITAGDEPVSSSQIRALLRDGSVNQANRLLGWQYAVEGEVIHGNARGRGLGFPTANLKLPPEKIIPANGVYATWAWIAETADGGSQRLPAVTNIGLRPTFPGEPDAPRVEAHLLDFSHDLYGQTLKLEFVERLRPEQRFPSIDALRAQITADSQKAREVFANAP